MILVVNSIVLSLILEPLTNSKRNVRKFTVSYILQSKTNIDRNKAYCPHVSFIDAFPYFLFIFSSPMIRKVASYIGFQDLLRITKSPNYVRFLLDSQQYLEGIKFHLAFLRGGVRELFISKERGQVDWRPYFGEDPQLVSRSVFSSSHSIISSVLVKLTTIRSDGRVDVLHIFLSHFHCCSLSLVYFFILLDHEGKAIR